MLVSGNSPAATLPTSMRVGVLLSRARPVMPLPGIKVENRKPSPAGVSWVRKPDVASAERGTRAAVVG